MNPNRSGRAYALTVLSPIKEGFTDEKIAYADWVRNRLQDWNGLDNSPMMRVPNTYLCRYFVLDDIYTESLPTGSALDVAGDYSPYISREMRMDALPKKDQLKSRYLVFSCNFHCGDAGDLDSYLLGWWSVMQAQICEIWQYCYGFEEVKHVGAFIHYIKKCQLDAALFFDGSNDEPLEEQLKALYLKNEFAQFAAHHQGSEVATLRKNFDAFLRRVAPSDWVAPTWSPGKYRA